LFYMTGNLVNFTL